MNIEIGCDIVSIKRVKSLIENPSFIKKVYTSKEIALATTYKDPTYFYATRFAGKEAILKACNIKYEFNEIEILKNVDGKPLAKITNDENINIKLSLSYEQDYATAFCIVIS